VVKQFTDLIDSAESSWQTFGEVDDYVRGKFPLPQFPMIGGQIDPRLPSLFRQSVVPVLGLIVEAVTQRLRVDGFRERGQDDPVNDLWEWWQRSGFDRAQRAVWSDAMTFADGYIAVTPNGDTPRFTAESPMALAVERDPLDPVNLSVAAKRSGNVGWLYTFDAIHRLERDDRPGFMSGWRLVKSTPHDAGECPMVRVPNRVDSLGRSHSDITPLMPLQDSLNLTALLRTVVEGNMAWAQRWIAGLTVEKDKQGRAIPPVRAGADQLVVSKDPDTKFGQWQASSSQDLLESMEATVRRMATISQVPVYYLAQTAISNISEPALAMLEGTLSARVDSRQTAYSEALEHAMRIGGRMVGTEVPEDLETVWASLERRSQAQQTDAALKLRSIGMPIQFLLSDVLGLTPQNTERVMGMLEREQAETALAQAKAFGVDGAAVDPQTRQEMNAFAV